MSPTKDDELNKLRARYYLAVVLLKEVMAWHADKTSADYNECDEHPCAFCVRAALAIGQTGVKGDFAAELFEFAKSLHTSPEQPL